MPSVVDRCLNHVAKLLHLNSLLLVSDEPTHSVSKLDVVVVSMSFVHRRIFRWVDVEHAREFFRIEVLSQKLYMSVGEKGVRAAGMMARNSEAVFRIDALSDLVDR